MSIASEITRIQNNIDAMYDTLESMGATMPAERNSDNLVTSFVSSPIMDNFLPAQSIIHVELDGSGDFTSLEDALDYIRYKWSNGQVNIVLGEGTFNLTGNSTKTVILDGSIPYLYIYGHGVNKTIICSDNVDAGNYIIEFTNNTTNVKIANLTIKNNNGNKNTDYRGLLLSRGVQLFLANVNFEGINRCVYAISLSKVNIEGEVHCVNCDACFIVGNGSVLTTSYLLSIYFDNVKSALVVWNGGQINGYGTKLYFTNVTNRFNVERNTLTSQGIINGEFLIQ